MTYSGTVLVVDHDKLNQLIKATVFSCIAPLEMQPSDPLME